MEKQETTYIEIMIQSLNKKKKVLDQIVEWDERQHEILVDPNGDVDAFDESVEAKSELITQLENLDSGFEKLYERVKEELEDNKETYKDQIKKMQDLIREVTDRSIKIQAQEARNKEEMTRKFARVKAQARQVRASAGATAEYYKSMSRTNYVDPQFLDNKK